MPGNPRNSHFQLEPAHRKCVFLLFKKDTYSRQLEMSPLDAAGAARSPATLRSADPAGAQVQRRATRTRCSAVGPLNGRFRTSGLFGGMVIRVGGGLSHPL